MRGRATCPTSCAPATSWSSTPRPRCPPRCPRGAPTAPARAAPLDPAAAAPARTAGSSSCGAGAEPFRGGRAGDVLHLPGGGRATLETPYLTGARLWGARLELPEPLLAYLARHGAPIRYRYVPDAHPLSAYETAYATEPGSAEMPSAGRPVTPAVLTALAAQRRHGGADRPAHRRVLTRARRAPVSRSATASRPRPRGWCTATRRWGGRVIAVGTTVVRALETVARADGTVEAGEGWTALVVTPARGVRVVDGLLTGWHEPEASHLDMLEAIAGRALVERSYAAALQAGYLWHEFGDVHLLLPGR